VQGFFIEMSRAQAERVPADYLRRQTVKGAERFITPELKGFEDKVLSRATRRWRARSSCMRSCWKQLIDRAARAAGAPRRPSRELDALGAGRSARHAATGLPAGLSRRTRHRDRRGRHPVVEQFIDTPFVPNDLALDEARRMLIVTGPNMGGKSTYMRQAALIAILAHIGSFVPARARGDRAARPHLHAHRRGR
jgi:DNA mismatch repair protein MutS